MTYHKGFDNTNIIYYFHYRPAAGRYTSRRRASVRVVDFAGRNPAGAGPA